MNSPTPLPGARYSESAAWRFAMGSVAGRVSPAPAEQPAFARLARYYDDPVGFARECISWRVGEGLAPYQAETLRKLIECRRVTRRGPHGLGKTTMEAIACLWFALTREATPERGDWKVVTTASGWRQLTHYLWPEIRKWARRLRWDAIGRDPFSSLELLQLNLKLGHGEAFAVASSDPSLIEGAHADRILYLFDESKIIAASVFDAAEGALSTGEASALAVSTPGEPIGRFYEMHARKPGYEDWDARHITAAEVIAAGRMNPAWREQRRRQWGERSAVFQNRCDGEFASSESDGIIPLAWVELANQRWLEWHDRTGGAFDRLDTVGCDLADGGEDTTVSALRAGQTIVELRPDRYSDDVMEVTGRLKGLIEAHGGRAVVDSIGIGAGVLPRLKEQHIKAEGFNAAHGSDRKDKSGELGFANRRAEAWWNLREMLDPSGPEALALPPDDRLIGDLTAPRYRVLSGGRILVESKDDLRKAERLGRSTDYGDAVVMAFARSNAPGKGAYL